MRKKIFIALAFIVAIILLFVTLGQNNKDAGVKSSPYEQLNPQTGEEIGSSWNPPRSKDCAVIVGAIGAVTVDASITGEDAIKQAIIKNTKLAAARLSILAQESLDKEIAGWSYKAALILVQFPEAITTGNQAAVTSLYDEIGKMVEKPPASCDNTLSRKA